MPIAAAEANRIASQLQQAADNARRMAKSDEDIARRNYCAALALVECDDKKSVGGSNMLGQNRR